MYARILIVDDNALIRNLVRRSLESVGWQICGEACNGQEAVDKAQQLHPNFIVLDLSMPVMNGLEAAKILLRLMPSVSLIMFTSFITEHLKREALSNGIKKVIAKEDSIANLLDAVRSLAGQNAA
jgi:two-component system chemotaxis response regulator CheY